MSTGHSKLFYLFDCYWNLLLVCGDEQSDKLNIDILSAWGQDDHF